LDRESLSGSRSDLAAFLDRLCQVRVLDPACGSGNFLTIECRGAVLAYDFPPQARKDADGNRVTQWDGVTFKKHPVTGEDIPYETARMPVWDYPNARPAEWPAADFVVGNPPSIGNKRMRSELGDGYVETLREVWPEVPGPADYVMYW
jgi:hypothetical protein